MKVLVHDHPQLTYFARIYKETYTTNPQYFFLDGPSWMQSLTVEMHKYLKSTGLLVKLNGTYNYISQHDNSFRRSRSSDEIKYLIKSHHSHEKLHKLIENSCVDTLCRNLDPDVTSLLYFEGNNAQRQSFIETKFEQFIQLVGLYMAIIDYIKPDRIYISHGVYNCYVSLYIASILSDIEIRIHHGGYATRYFANDIAANLTPRYIISNMYNQMVPSDVQLGKYRDRSITSFSSISLLGKDHKNSFVPLLLSTASSVKVAYTYRVLIVTMPIFSEVHRMFDDTKSRYIFDNKWDYIKSIIKMYNPTNQNKLIIHLHPHRDKKGDQNVVNSMLQILGSLIQLKNIQISHDLHDLETFANSSEFGFNISQNLDILSEGSTPIELAQAGYMCNCVNDNLAPIGAYNKIKDINELNYFINNHKSSMQKIDDYQFILKSKVMAKMFGRTSKLTPALSELQEIDKYFHFGRITKSPNSDSFFIDIKNYLDNYNLRSISNVDWNVQEDIL